MIPYLTFLIGFVIGCSCYYNPVKEYVISIREKNRKRIILTNRLKIALENAWTIHALSKYEIVNKTYDDSLSCINCGKYKHEHIQVVRDQCVDVFLCPQIEIKNKTMENELMVFKIKELVRQLKQENMKRADTMNGINISDYNRTVNLHKYNHTIEIIKRIEAIVGTV